MARGDGESGRQPGLAAAAETGRDVVIDQKGGGARLASQPPPTERHVQLQVFHRDAIL